MKIAITIVTTIIVCLLIFWFYKLSTIPLPVDHIQVSPQPPPIIRNPWFTNEPSKGDEPNDIINQQLRK